MLIILIHSVFMLAPIKFQLRFCFQSFSMFFSRVLARRRALAASASSLHCALAAALPHRAFAGLRRPAPSPPSTLASLLRGLAAPRAPLARVTLAAPRPQARLVARA